MKKTPKTSKFAIQPMADRVVIRPEEPMKKTASGIIIPETVRGLDQQRGTVVAVGPGKIGDDNELIPVALKVGDEVIYVKGYDETLAKEVEMDNQKYYIVSETNVIATIN